MKLTVALLLSVALGLAAEVRTTPKSDQKAEESKTDKRALTEGNAGVQKRVAVSVSPSPGIEYVESKETHQDKSPAQQIYATPVPQVAKISDVLTGQGVQFPAAIASHLYSPVSVYQARLGSPTTYEISAPVPSQLAYSEHKIYQPQQNAIAYYNQPQKLQTEPKPNARIITYNQQPEQQVYQPQQIFYQHQIPAQQQQPIYYHNLPQTYQQPQIYNQQPQIYNKQPQIYNQPPPPLYTHNLQIPAFHEGPQIAYNQVQFQQPYYNQERPLVQLVQGNQVPLQPGLLYGRQQVGQQQLGQQQLGQQQQTQRELMTQQPTKVFEKQASLQTQQQQAYDKQQQQSGGAVSYASFSQGPSSPNYQPQAVSPQPNHVQPSIQYAPAKAQPSANSLPALQKSQPQVVYPQQQSYQPYQPQIDLVPAPQVYHQPIYPQGQGILVQNPGYAAQPLAVAPTFAPVQYYGKFAQNIFGGYQPQ